MNARQLFARAELERARIERAGGPAPSHRARYLKACGIVDNCREQLRGLGFIPLLPLLGWAVAALVATAGVVGGIAIARTVETATEGAQGFVRQVASWSSTLVAIAGVAGGLWLAAKIAPELATGYRLTRQAAVA